MPRPVTLFTGQWADLPLEQLAPLVRKMGYDGVELACWGDHFDVDKALSSKRYVQEKWDLLRATASRARPCRTTWSARPSAT
jgi:sugar phosphate isomerase/epimerase